MSNLADQIVTQGYCVGNDGRSVRLHSHTSIDQCRFLASLAKEAGQGDSLEVGLAFGLSSLYLAEYTAQRGGTHIIIDPFQHDAVWQGIGLANLERAGLRSACRFIEQDARTVLPQLVREGQRLTFAYIDASKRLDDMIIMFHYIFQMLNLGGIIAFDDVAWFPGILEAMHYISRMPGVEICGQFAKAKSTLRRRAIQRVVSLLPRSNRVFLAEWTRPENAGDIRAGCIALRKVSDDVGDWAWHPS